MYAEPVSRYIIKASREESSAVVRDALERKAALGINRSTDDREGDGHRQAAEENELTEGQRR